MPFKLDIKEDHFYRKGFAEEMPIKKTATIANLPIDQIREIKKQHKF